MRLLAAAMYSDCIVYEYFKYSVNGVPEKTRAAYDCRYLNIIFKVIKFMGDCLLQPPINIL